MSPSWLYADSTRLIPVDEVAERAAAGLAIVSHADAIRLLPLTPLFYDRRLADIVLAAAAVGPEVRDGPSDWDEAMASGFEVVVHGCVQRVKAIERITEHPPALLRQLMAARPPRLYEDPLTERLVAAHQARLRIAALVGQLDNLGVDTEVLTEAHDQRHEIGYAVVRVAAVSGGLIAGRGELVDLVDALIDLGAHVGIRPADIGVAIMAHVARPSEDP